MPNKNQSPKPSHPKNLTQHSQTAEVVINTTPDKTSTSLPEVVNINNEKTPPNNSTSRIITILKRFSWATSLAAVIGFLINFSFTYWAFYTQKQQWEAENISRVSWVNAEFFAWKIIHKEEAGKIKFDTKTLAVNEIENDANTGNYRLLTRVVPFDSKAYLLLFSGDTLKEAEEKVKEGEKQIGHALGNDTLDYASQYRVIFKFENIGNTVSRNVQFFIKMHNPWTEQWIPEQEIYTKPVDLAPNKGTEQFFDFFLDAKKNVPQQINFVVKTKWIDVNDKSCEHTEDTTYSLIKGSFTQAGGH